MNNFLTKMTKLSDRIVTRIRSTIYREIRLDDALRLYFENPTAQVFSLEDEIAAMKEPIAVVGNGPLAENSGGAIDAHPTVIRFNSFRIEEYRASTGVRMTHWCCNRAPQSAPKNYETVPIVFPGQFTSCLPAMARRRQRMVYCLQDYRLSWQRPRTGSSPTTGFMLVSLLAVLGKKTSVFGFDGLLTGHYWNPDHEHSPHHINPLRPGAELESLANLPGVSVYTDSRLAKGPSTIKAADLIKNTMSRPSSDQRAHSFQQLGNAESMVTSMEAPIALVCGSQFSPRFNAAIAKYRTVIRVVSPHAVVREASSDISTHICMGGVGRLGSKERLCRGQFELNLDEQMMPHQSWATLGKPMFVPLGSSAPLIDASGGLNLEQPLALVRDWRRLSLPILSVTRTASTEFAACCLLLLLDKQIATFGLLEADSFVGRTGEQWKADYEIKLLRSSPNVTIVS